LRQLSSETLVRVGYEAFLLRLPKVDQIFLKYGIGAAGSSHARAVVAKASVVRNDLGVNVHFIRHSGVEWKMEAAQTVV
jgi:hypothetical protein